LIGALIKHFGSPFRDAAVIVQGGKRVLVGAAAARFDPREETALRFRLLIEFADVFDVAFTFSYFFAGRSESGRRFGGICALVRVCR
jgi:hypothetical protein